MLKALDGRKTWLGLVLSNVAVVFTQVSFALDADPATVCSWPTVGSACVVVWGAVHKLVKGD